MEHVNSTGKSETRKTKIQKNRWRRSKKKKNQKQRESTLLFFFYREGGGVGPNCTYEKK